MAFFFFFLPSDFLFPDLLSVQPDKCGQYHKNEGCEQGHGVGNMITVSPPVL